MDFPMGGKNIILFRKLNVFEHSHNLPAYTTYPAYT